MRWHLFPKTPPELYLSYLTGNTNVWYNETTGFLRLSPTPTIIFIKHVDFG